MSTELGNINREIKAAMRRFINNEDDVSISDIIKLAKERERIMIHRPFIRKQDDER